MEAQIVEDKAHNIKVEKLRAILTSYDLPSLPLTTIKSAFYQADIVTRLNHKFIPLDYVNSRGQVAFDIGGLYILSERDICDWAIAVIDDKLWEKFLHDFRKLKLDLPSKVTMMPMKEVNSYFKELTTPVQPTLAHTTPDHTRPDHSRPTQTTPFQPIPVQ